MRIVVGVALTFVVALGADARAQQPAKPFEPVSGQAGKDVVWVPTAPDLLDLMLKIAEVTPKDFVMDLGSGDGRNIIAAAKLGARGVGVEYNPDMVALSRRLAAEAGVADRATFIEGDMYEADISKASVMALFLLPVNLNRLAPKFLDLAPGSRIVGNTFGFDGWQPDYRQSLGADGECTNWCEALLWIVPAKVQGTWTLADGSLALTQTYQMLEGTLTRGAGAEKLTQAKMRGDDITFIAGGLTYTGKVRGNVMEGTVTTPSGAVAWRATRSGK
jgi:SAM-dependent methyltransferase